MSGPYFFRHVVDSIIAIAVIVESFSISIMNLRHSDKIEFFTLKICEIDIKQLPSNGMQPFLAAYAAGWLPLAPLSLLCFPFQQLAPEDQILLTHL